MLLDDVQGRVEIMLAETPIPRVVRTAPQLRAARYALRLSAGGLAKMVGAEDVQTVRRWEAGESEIPASVKDQMEVAMEFLMRLAEVTDHLDALQDGETLCGGLICRHAASEIDQSEIARYSVAKTFIETALAKITKQPPIDGDESTQIHWYALKRITPTKEAASKDEWVTPSETRPEAALAYFERNEGFTDGLTICEDTSGAAEFILEKRKILRRRSAAGQSLRPGKIVDSYFVNRA